MLANVSRLFRRKENSAIKVIRMDIRIFYHPLNGGFGEL